ncbi:regulatory factor X-associated protein-like [Diadema antillarum]|uniref:regulatory factor X-associated protein-like n=1 Tax=Diadema antillarum TaxID=105358 RepID=UPI003A8BB843
MELPTTSAPVSSRPESSTSITSGPEAATASQPTAYATTSGSSVATTVSPVSASQPVTVLGKQVDLNPAAMAGLRSASPSPSEASTGSSNHSLDLMRCKNCSAEGCQEVLVVAGKRRKGPWMCNYHRNKTYKAKKKQKDQIATSMQIFKKKQEDSIPRSANLQALLNGDQPPPSDGLPRLDQVLNEKKLALLRSPTIIKFLKESQQQLSHSHQAKAQATPMLPGERGEHVHLMSPH